MLIISLIEKHIFPVIIAGSEFFQHAFLVDPMLGAELFPEFHANFSRITTNNKK